MFQIFFFNTEPGNKRLHNDYDYFKTRAASISKLENVTAFDKAEAEDNMTRDYENLCRGSLKVRTHTNMLTGNKKQCNARIDRYIMISISVRLFHQTLRFSTTIES